MFAIGKTCRNFVRGSNHAQRHVHRTPDFRYLKEGTEKSEWYRAVFYESSEKMKEFPQLMNRYLKTAAAMKIKGKVPFVHAQPSYYRIPRLFLETICKKDLAKTHHFRFLRFPSKQYEISKDVLMVKIQEYIKENGSTGWTPGEWNFNISRLDTEPKFRPFMVSLSYSMMDYTKAESAFDFLFHHPTLCPEKEKQMMQSWIGNVMQIYGKKDKISDVVNEIAPYFHDYAQLPVNSLLVIGIPEEKVNSFAYDAKSFGTPTGKDISEVAKAPWTSTRAFTKEEGGLQARLLMFKDTMDPNCGIEVVDVNDESEVENFCNGYALTPVSEVPEFARLFPNVTMPQERAYRERESLLDQKIKQIALGL